MTDLNLALMDDEPTQAAEPPTEVAPTNDETQSIHAWALDSDDTETARRSWKLPVALAALAAAAAVTTGVVMAWPKHSQHSQHSQPVPPSAAAAPTVIRGDADKAPQYLPPTDPDQRFIWLLRQQDYRTDNPDGDIAAGHKICTILSSGETPNQVVNDVVRGSAITKDTATIFVDTAMHQFCPQYFSH